MSLASLSLDVGFAELRVLAIRHYSKVNLASKLKHLDTFFFLDSNCHVILFYSAILLKSSIQEVPLWICRWC